MRKKLLSWDETLFRDPDVFELSYVPEQFDYRDEQTEALAFAVRPGVRGGKILDTVCRGPPSTGKTTSVKKIFELLAETTERVVPVHVNCKIDSTEYAVFTRIYTSITKQAPPSSGTSNKQVLDLLANYLQSAKVQPLICLDDANYLIYQKEFTDVLYPLLRLHEVFPEINLSLIVIISDPRIDLMENLDVRTRSTFHPEIIPYPPYTAREVAGILNLRVKAGLYPNVLAPEYLDMIVESCMKYGDVRMGLELIRRSVLSAERDARRCVSEEDVSKAVSALVDMHKLDAIKALSREELLVLKTAVELFTDTTSPTTKEVLDALPEDGPKKTRTAEILNHLDVIGLIDLEYANSGLGRRRYVNLHGEKAEFLKAIESVESISSNQ